MWLGATLLPLGVLFATAKASETPCSPKACTRDGPTTDKIICGSDGLSYPNRCHFERARCIHKNLTIMKRGPCRQQKPCRDWILYKQLNPGYKFQANCRPDGVSYASAQCHLDTGHCWCVTSQGVPISYTTTRYKPNQKVRCGRKKITRRRSPRRQSTRRCTQPDKVKFNNNLLNIIHTEYGRYSEPLKHTSENDRKVNEWKFHALDINKDGYLDKIEYMGLKRVAKKAVKPKRCAKTFPKICDINDDALIEAQEWSECLKRDGMDDTRPGVDSTIIDDDNDGSSINNYDPPSILDENEENEDDYSRRNLTSRPSLEEHTLGGHIDESSDIRDDDPPDCLTDRNTALMDGGQFYVPECTHDGRYKRIQCYKAAGYCFCVSEDTGKNIPGTSVKHGTPKCDTYDINRTMKGCPDEKKAAFLRDLFKFLRMRANKTENLNTLPWMSSEEEKIATWSFVVFDQNKNKMLDRNEWKTFKMMVGGEKSLKKCGKKLPRYCDSNKDRHISMTEWLNCLNVQQVQTTSVSPSSSRAGKKNPLDILHQD